MYHSFEQLEVWKRGCQLAVAVYDALREPVNSHCVTKCSGRRYLSIPSNIAEGAERGGKDFERFLRIARGSAAELRTQTYIAKKIGLLADDKFCQLIAELKEISKMLTGLARSTTRKPRSE